MGCCLVQQEFHEGVDPGRATGIFLPSTLSWRSRLSWLTIVALALTVLTRPSHAAEIRLALVIGNDEYKSGKLATPANDAGLAGDALTAAGFTVTGARNLDQATLQESFREFFGQLAAGHLAHDVDLPLQAIPVSDFMPPPPASGPVPASVKPSTPPLGGRRRLFRVRRQLLLSLRRRRLPRRPRPRNRRALPAKRLPRSTVIRRVNEDAGVGARSYAAYGFRRSQQDLAALLRSS